MFLSGFRNDHRYKEQFKISVLSFESVFKWSSDIRLTSGKDVHSLCPDFAYTCLISWYPGGVDTSHMKVYTCIFTMNKHIPIVQGFGELRIVCHFNYIQYTWLSESETTGNRLEWNNNMVYRYLYSFIAKTHLFLIMQLITVWWFCCNKAM